MNHPTVERASDTEVVLTDCGVDNSTEYDLAGNVAETNVNQVSHYRVLVIPEAGVWKVAEFQKLEEPCSPP